MKVVSVRASSAMTIHRKVAVSCHSRAGGNLITPRLSWTPAPDQVGGGLCAGVTDEGRAYILSTALMILSLALLLGASCVKKAQTADTGADAKVTTLGSIEVTAQLEEIPGEVRNDPLYDYAHVMKYKVLQVHRGKVDKDTIYVGHYNPAKPRDGVADARVQQIGGNLKQFRVGEVHRLALEVPIDDYFMGGIINKYFGVVNDPIYWAVWTNKAAK